MTPILFFDIPVCTVIASTIQFTKKATAHSPFMDLWIPVGIVLASRRLNDDCHRVSDLFDQTELSSRS